MLPIDCLKAKEQSSNQGDLPEHARPGCAQETQVTMPDVQATNCDANPT